MLRALSKCFVLLVCCGLLPAVEPLSLGTFAQPGSGGQVEVLIEHDGGPEAVLISRFTVTAFGLGWHFYSTDLPESGSSDGTGRPAKVAIPPGLGLEAIGDRIADREVQSLVVGGASKPSAVYPAGPVTIRQPVRLPQGDGERVPVELAVWYMVCNDETCKRPVEGAPMTVEVPTHPDGVPALAGLHPERVLAAGRGPVQRVELAQVIPPDRGTELRISLEHRGEREAVLVSEFRIPKDEAGWHFYSTHLPEQGIAAEADALGIGKPTKVVPAPDAPLVPISLRIADAEVELRQAGGVEAPAYPDGPVTLRQSVILPQGDGSPVPIELQVWSMLCNEETCRRPIDGLAVTVEVPSHPQGISADAALLHAMARAVARAEEVAVAEIRAQALASDEAGPAADAIAARPAEAGWAAMLFVALCLVATAVVLGLIPRGDGQRGAGPWGMLAGSALLSMALWQVVGLATPYATEEGIDWEHPTTVAELERLIAEAHAAGEAALLDFTGPSCANCQEMAKNIFIIDEVRAAWNSGVPVEIDTDRHKVFEDWQHAHFSTYNRPLYVRLEPGLPVDQWGDAPRWDARITRDDQDGIAALAGFLRGEGEAGGRSIAAASAESDWLGFVLLALAGGLFTLVMPCTYPMIPFTITFFSKQSAAGRRLVPLAACYALGIIGFFALLGLVVGVVFGAGFSAFSGSPVVNLVIGALFLVFGVSLLGVFLLRLPGNLEAKLGGGRGGYAGALLMGLTFAITAFTCTAPFAGLVLGEAASDAATAGTWFKAVIGMAIYASVIAVPFFFLSISPGLMQKMPRAGSWMSEFKIVGGLVELGAALKFLAISDVRWGWGLFTRVPVLAAWSALAFLCAFYALGALRMRDDQPVGRPSATRLILALGFAVLAVWMLGGALGNHLGLLESFFPGDATPLRSAVGQDNDQLFQWRTEDDRGSLNLIDVGAALIPTFLLTLAIIGLSPQSISWNNRSAGLTLLIVWIVSGIVVLVLGDVGMQILTTIAIPSFVAGLWGIRKKRKRPAD